jgi:hypothetical protein
VTVGELQSLLENLRLAALTRTTITLSPDEAWELEQLLKDVLEGVKRWDEK